MINRLLLLLLCLCSTIQASSSSTTAREPFNKTLLQLVIEYIHKNHSHPALQDMSFLPAELKDALWVITTTKFTKNSSPLNNRTLNAKGNKHYILFPSGYRILIRNLDDPDDSQSKQLNFASMHDGFKGLRISLTSDDKICAVASSSEVRVYELPTSFENYVAPQRSENLPVLKKYSFTECIKVTTMDRYGARLLLFFSDVIRLINLKTDAIRTIKDVNLYGLEDSADTLEQLQGVKFVAALSDSGRYAALYDYRPMADSYGRVTLYDFDKSGSSTFIQSPIVFLRKFQLIAPSIRFVGDVLYYVSTLNDAIKIFDAQNKKEIYSLKHEGSCFNLFGVSEDGSRVEARENDCLKIVWSNPVFKQTIQKPPTSVDRLAQVSSKS